MAWKQIDEYTDRLVCMIDTIRLSIKSSGTTPEGVMHRRELHSREVQLMYVLLAWYQTLEAIPKFKIQREYAKAKLTEYFPAFAEGYFKKIKKTSYDEQRK